MSDLIAKAIDRHAIEHTSPVPEIYEWLRATTHAETEMARVQVGPLEGRLLTRVARLVGARRTGESGSFTRCSSPSIAARMAEGGQLITCAVNAEATALGRSPRRRQCAARRPRVRAPGKGRSGEHRLQSPRRRRARRIRSW